jgi:hypothetical protein
MIAPRKHQQETPEGAFYFCAETGIAPMWPPQNTPLAYCLSMLIAGLEVTQDSFGASCGHAHLDVLIYVLRGLGWSIGSHPVQKSESDPFATKLSYFMSDAVKSMTVGEKS